MEENQKTEKIIVAYRKKRKTNKKSINIFFTLSAIFFAILGVLCLTRKDNGFKIMGAILCVLAVVYLVCMYFLKRNVEKIEKINKYPEIAMLIYGPYLCVVRDQIEKIRLTDIQKVSKTNDIIYTPFVTITRSFGNIKIKANGNKYIVCQIANVTEVLKTIKEYVKQAKSNEII